MGLVASIKVNGNIYWGDINQCIDLYHIEERAHDRAKELRKEGYLVRVRHALCTGGTEECWQVFKYKAE